MIIFEKMGIRKNQFVPVKSGGNPMRIRKNFILIPLLLALFSLSLWFNCARQKPMLSAENIRLLPREQKIDHLLRKMTLEEKVALLGGTGFTTTPIPRLGIPAMKMCDGPLGSRMKVTAAGVQHGGIATNFSAPIALAATWDDSLVQVIGKAIGAEAQAKTFDVILAPCINIARVPLGGRTFEGFGEDPLLVSKMTVAYVKGVQSTGVVATTKHYVANNQEKFRMLASSNVSERALREIYFPAFKAAVQEANTRAIMAAYNKINGRYACANRYLLWDVLKKEWGFSGIAMSDWGAVHSTIPTANAGLDLEMPHGRYFNQKLVAAVKAKKVSIETINDKVRRILRVMDEAGLLGSKPKTYPTSVDTARHDALALHTAEEAIVLLKNNNQVLPLNPDSLHSLAVIGPNARQAIISAGGSGYLDSYKKISPLKGIRHRVGKKIHVRYALGAALRTGALPAISPKFLTPAGNHPGKHGLLAEYFANPNLDGKPVLTRIDSTVYFVWNRKKPAPAIPRDNFSVRWTGFFTPPQTGTFQFGVSSDDGFRLYLDGRLVLQDWRDGKQRLISKRVHFQKGKKVAIRLEYYQRRGQAVAQLGISSVPPDERLRKAVRLAKSSDAAVLCVGLNRILEGEGRDRTTLNLPPEQEKLIRAVAAVNPKTIVILNNGTPITMARWINDVPTILEAWYTGQETGTALARILFGDVNPSGKLPLTFPQSWEQTPVAKTYPGTKDSVIYKEGIYVGYRYYDKNQLRPLFPFGFGLSYTSFAYKNLSISPNSVPANGSFTVSLWVKNTGSRAGDEVVEVYVHEKNPVCDRPPKELKAFRRVHLLPGQSKKVEMTLKARDLAYFDPAQKAWVVQPDIYQILVGKSSRDIQLTGNVVVQ